MRSASIKAMLFALLAAWTAQPASAQPVENAEISQFSFSCQMQNGQPHNVRVNIRGTPRSHGWYRIDFFGRSVAESRSFTVPANQPFFLFAVPAGVADVGLTWSSLPPAATVEHFYRVNAVTIPGVVPTGPGSCALSWPPGEERTDLMVPQRRLLTRVEGVEYVCLPAPGGPRTVRLTLSLPLSNLLSVQVEFRNAATGQVINHTRTLANPDLTFAVPGGDWLVTAIWFGVGVPLDANSPRSDPRLIRVPPVPSVGGAAACRVNTPLRARPRL